MLSAKDYLPIDFWDGLTGAFFCRHGGVSPVPFASLNLSYGVGDRPEHVAENRSHVVKALGLAALASTRQVHGDRILVIDDSLPIEGEYEGCDALITDRPRVGVMIQQADCQAVVLYDPAHRVVANVHVGWRGSVANILSQTMGRLTADFGTDPGQVMAAISPSLGPCCAEFVNFATELPASFHAYRTSPFHFDFWAISRWQLKECGVEAAHIRTTGICTRCNPNYFSYRREAMTGRNATVVALL